MTSVGVQMSPREGTRTPMAAPYDDSYSPAVPQRVSTTTTRTTTTLDPDDDLQIQELLDASSYRRVRYARPDVTDTWGHYRLKGNAEDWGESELSLGYYYTTRRSDLALQKSLGSLRVKEDWTIDAPHPYHDPISPTTTAHFDPMCPMSSSGRSGSVEARLSEALCHEGSVEQGQSRVLGQEKSRVLNQERSRALEQERSETQDEEGSRVAGQEGSRWWERGSYRVSRSLEDLPSDIQEHILRCQCTCDHLGYGNFSAGSLSRLTNGGCSAHLRKAVVSPLQQHPIDPHQYHHHHQHDPLASPPTSTATSTTTTSAKLKGDGSGGGGGWVLCVRVWRLWACVVVVVLAGVAGVGVGVPLALRVDPSATLPERLATAKTLLRDTPLVDGHNDLPWNIRKFMHNRLHSFNLTAQLKKLRPWSRSSWSHTDLPRLREGMVGAQFWVSYVPCEAQLLNAVQLTIEQIDLIKRLIDQYPHHLRLATSAEEVEKAFHDGVIASLIGVEGGHAIQNSLGVLRALRDMGVRYLTLTHTCSTPWAECARARESDDEDPKAPRGLTHFGRTVVKEMNRLGMMVDLSHVSQQTMRAALGVSRAPVIFSHSSVYAICKNPRNVPDDILRKVARNGGVVMISFYNYFLTCSKEATISDVIEHINHVRKVAGIDHVGIGADFDGVNMLPEGLGDVSGYPRLFAELLGDATWSLQDLSKLAGLNLLRVMRQVEKVRERLQEEKVLPYEEDVPLTAGDHEACFYRFLRPPDGSE